MQDNIKTLIQYDKAYFDGTPIVSDEFYDAFRKKTQEENPNHPYFLTIGSDTRGGKTKLPYKMGSLDQKYEGETLDWVNKYNGLDKTYVATSKLDGISATLIFKNGVLTNAYSRGDGINGADITRHVKHICQKINTTAAFIAVRCELIMSNHKFFSYVDEFANPRSMVAGLFNREDTNKAYISDVDVVAYEILESSDDLCFSDKVSMLETLKQIGFNIPIYETIDGSLMNDGVLTNMLDKFRGLSIYTLDGLVLTYNDYKSFEAIRKADTLNPEHSIKYKISGCDEKKEAVVMGVNFDISKSGYFKPVIEISPVSLYGTTVTYTTGFNYKFIVDNKINTGSKLLMTKSGSVIPYILEVLTQSEKPAEIGDMWEWNNTKVEASVTTENHPTVIFKQVVSFFESMKIDLLKEATVRAVMSVNQPSCFYDAIVSMCNMYEMEWTKIVGVNGKKIFNSLHTKLNNCKEHIFIGSLPYLGIGFGTRRAKTLLSGLGGLEKLKTADISHIAAIEGFDIKTAEYIIGGVDITFKLISELQTDGVLRFIEDAPVGDSLKELNVVFTGFRDSELEAYIVKNGGIVGSGVSKKTTCVVAADISSKSSKIDKAKKLNIDVHGVDEFKVTIGYE